ncbi:MAG: hypothetical protein UH239_08855 [Acutalibacteraceae bacterium]|nr:hypothetical protein [Acutalibacteraceae bacterium]
MTTKIDNEKLEQYIGELNTLHTSWSNNQTSPVDQGENGGGTITEMMELSKSLEDMQNVFVLLVSNTLSYMRQRKASVETKDAEAVANIQE